MLTLTSPVDTPFHHWPAGLKLALLCGFTVWLFAASGVWLLAASLAIVALCYVTGGWHFVRHGLRLLRPLWLFLLVIALWHGWTGDWQGGTVVALRLITALAAANLVTMTTGLAPMIRVVEWLTQPLSPILPPRRLALAFALVIRFVPVLSRHAETITEAWRARSPKRPRWRILPPLALSAIDEADRVAEALRARGGVG
ncbi:MAG: energy-coupling factor transporter transmembrane component T family protein [Paracoccaceae bacterium]